MNWKNTPERYGAGLIGLHWLMLVLIAVVYALIELCDLFPKGSAGREAMKQWHFTLGLLVWVLAVLRLVFRFSMPQPRITPQIPVWQELLSDGMRVLLYAMMLGLPLTGWLMLNAAGQPASLFGLELPTLIGENEDWAQQIKEMHESAGMLGYALIGLHAMAALFHHYWMADNTLRRMLPAQRESAS